MASQNRNISGSQRLPALTGSMCTYSAPAGTRPCSDSGNSSKQCKRPALEILTVQARGADRKSMISPKVMLGAETAPWKLEGRLAGQASPGPQHHGAELTATWRTCGHLGHRRGWQPPPPQTRAVTLPKAGRRQEGSGL